MVTVESSRRRGFPLAQLVDCVYGPPMNQSTRLDYRNVTMIFKGSNKKGEQGAVTAIENISFAVPDREVVSLIGPSGCGKSTLLNIGSGLYKPSAGEAYVDQELVTGPNSQVAFMLQKDLLLPWRTIIENVKFGVEIQGVKAAVTERARAKSSSPRAESKRGLCALASWIASSRERPFSQFTSGRAVAV